MKHALEAVEFPDWNKPENGLMLYFSNFLYFYVFSSKNWKWCKKPYPCFTPSAVNFCLHFSTMPTFLSRQFQHFIKRFLATCFSYKPLITNLNIEIWRFMYFFMSVYWKKVDIAVQEKLVFQKGYKKAKNLSFKKQDLSNFNSEIVAEI